MDRLREQVDTDDINAAHERPTRYPTEKNRFQLHCGLCGELYYVNELTAQRAKSAIQRDPSETPFYCERCEEEYSEDEHGHD